MKRTPPEARHLSGMVLFAPIAVGMFTAQVIATGFVYLSNECVHELVSAARSAGYFPVPTGPVTATLNSFGTAFWAGAFYTLSIGAGLTLAAWSGIQLWERLFRRKRAVMAAYFVLWAGLLAAVNFHGPALFPSLFCLLVPLSTGWTAFKMLPATPAGRDLLWIVPVATLIALTALWTTQLNRDLFITIRDHILLSNPAGRAVNDFYYRYTLYAAEAFKSFDQKTLRSCRLEGLTDNADARQWGARLAALDVLVLPEVRRPDLRLVFSGKKLNLISVTGREMSIDGSRFSANPAKALHTFSTLTDRYAPFRRTTLVGLLLGFPILLFVMVYGILRGVSAVLLSSRQATFAVSGSCMLIGLLLFMPMLDAKTIAVTPETIPSALAADQWTHRVAALRYIEEHKLDIADYPAYRQLLGSPLVVERYWLARAMASSRSEATYHQLLQLIRDGHLNVTCQAFYALGRRGRKAAIEPIKERISVSNHWYTQWYGYRALRRLGWHQTRSG